MKSYAVAIALAVSLGACADDKGPEDELPPDGKDDSFRKPTDHGLIEFSVPVTSVLTDAEKFHTWTFDLSDTASVELLTSYAVLGQRRTDTVLYLYRWNGLSWGSYIARNDDYGSTTYSRLVRQLGAGRYRALVKGHAETTRGKFKLTASCSGAGCAPGCLFGSTYHDISTAPGLETLSTLLITAANLDTLSTEAQSMLVRAVHESSHTDVTTPLEALARVDQEEMNVKYIRDEAGQRTFISFEYGAGDNSYGAVFEKQSEARATSIHDGDLYNCSVRQATCALPDTYTELRNGVPGFTRIATRPVTAANQLAAAENAQATEALRHAYGETLTIADGIAMTDDQAITVERYRDSANREVAVFQWYAGDTSVGAMFHADSVELAGVIDDSAIDGCSLFAQ